MRKILILLLWSSVCYGQVDTTKPLQPINGNGSRYKNMAIDSSARLPRDTFHLRVSDEGSISWKSGRFWQWSGHRWDTLASTAPSGAVISSGDLSPIFTSTVTAGAISFTLTSVSAYKLLGRGSGTGVPSYIGPIDSNWVTGLHTEAYYSTKFVTTITGGGTLTFSSGLLQTGSNVVALHQNALWNAALFQGFNVSAAQPLDGQTWVFDGSTNSWQLGTGGSGGGGSLSDIYLVSPLYAVNDSTAAVRFADNDSNGVVHNTDFIYWNGKIDSVHVRNDSLFDYVAGDESFRGIVGGGGTGVSGLANFYLKDSTLSNGRTVLLGGNDLYFQEAGGGITFALRAADGDMIFTSPTGESILSGTAQSGTYISASVDAFIQLRTADDQVWIHADTVRLATTLSGASAGWVFTLTDPLTGAGEWAAPGGGGETLQDVIDNGGSIIHNSTISLGANLFIGDNVGIDFKNGSNYIEIYGASIRLNRGWSGVGGTTGLPSGTVADSVVTINQTTGEIHRLNISSITGSSYTDEQAQDAIGAMVSAEFTYTDGTPLLAINAIAESKITNLVTDLAAKASLTGAETLTNKRWVARVGSTTSSGTPTINTDNVDVYKLTALAANITSFTTNLSGTPNDGDMLSIEITGTATRTITWGSSFVSSSVALPTTTSSTTTLTVILRYSTTSSYGTNKWICVNSF